MYSVYEEVEDVTEWVQTAFNTTAKFRYYANPNASTPELDPSIPFMNNVPFVITPETVTDPIPERVRWLGLPQVSGSGTWAGSLYTAPDCVEQPCIHFNESNLGSSREPTTERLKYRPDRHDITSCTISAGKMYDQDTCQVICVPGYEVANTTFLCDSTRQVALVDILYGAQDQALADSVPPEYARWVDGTKI
jgi:hypothetical protein